jgi:hypothetical protein
MVAYDEALTMVRAETERRLKRAAVDAVETIGWAIQHATSEDRVRV